METSSDLKFSLTHSHREFLRLLGENAGEVPFDWTKLTDRARDHIRQMFDMGILSETPLIGTRRHLVRLTDIGRNILTMIETKTC